LRLKEANRLLPKVIPLVQQLQGLHQSILKTSTHIQECSQKLAQGNGYPIQELRKQIEEFTQHQLNLLQAFQSAYQQLEALGAMLKDLSLGLVDFYTLREGEPVFLCWKLGEDKVQFWHRLEDGFAGRQPLE